MSRMDQEKQAADARLEGVISLRSATNKNNHYLLKAALKATGAFALVHDANTLFGCALSLLSATERERMRQLGAQFEAGRVEQVLLVEIPGPVDEALDVLLTETKKLKRHTYAKNKTIWLYRGRGYREDIEALVSAAGGHVSVSQIDETSASPANAEVVQSTGQAERKDASGSVSHRDQDDDVGRIESDSNEERAVLSKIFEEASDAGLSAELRPDGESLPVRDAEIGAVISTAAVADIANVDTDTSVSLDRSRKTAGRGAGHQPDKVRPTASLDRKDAQVDVPPTPLPPVTPDWLVDLKPDAVNFIADQRAVELNEVSR